MAILNNLIVHGSSRFLNIAQFNALKANTIGADKGVFNKLIATDAAFDSLDVQDLTAQNAKVVGLLDVQGELHTNSWTNANIANIGGSFYISPTVEPTDGTTTISITRNSATSWTITATGTFATNFIKSGTATSGVAWPANSLVLITGNIVVQNMEYPLGTLKGTLSSTVTATAATTSKTITLTGVTDAQNNSAPSVLEQLYEINGNANISGASFKSGKISLYKLGSYPIGIQMSSMGASSNSLIDIYGGVSTAPTVRIGHLGALSSYTDSAGNTRQPTGWGIYTDNGFFKGVIVADSGSIGHFTIDANSIYSGSHSAYNSNNAGIFLGRPSSSSSDYYIAGGPQAKWWLKSDGSAQIGAMTLSSAGVLAVPAANITGTLTASQVDVNGIIISGGIVTNTLTGGTFNTTDYIRVSTQASSSLTIGTSGAKTDWRIIAGKTFGVDKSGNLYATSANITGDIVAQSLTIGSGSSAYNGVAAINISGYDIEIISDSTGVVDSDNTTYLYPHLYHNGTEITTGINYSHFIWYQDGIEPGTAGDANNQGRYLATYGHNYRVTYDFDDGAVGGGTQVQTRTIDPSKYITKINDTGITIHPEVWTNQSSYIQLTGTGMELFNSSGVSIAQYGSTARIGYISGNNYNINITGTAIDLRYNTNVLNRINSNGMALYDGNGVANNNIIAQFGMNSAQIGLSNGTHSVIDANGFSIFNGLLPMMTLDNDSLDFNLVDTTAGTYVNLATFGGSTRIGQEEVGYAKVLLSPSVFNFLSSESTSVFKTGVASEETATSRVEISADWDSPTTTGLQLGTYVLAPNSSTTVSGVFYSSVVANLDAGVRFGLKIGIYKNDLTYTYIIFNETTYHEEGFTTGEAKTITGSAYDQPNVSVYYDGVATFTVSGTITNYSIVSWNFSRDKAVFTGQTRPIETKIYNTFIGGNAFVNSSNGAVYIGMSQKSETRSSDYDLYNAITALGWEDDVMVDIEFVQHTMPIDSSSTMINDLISLSKFVPSTANVIVTSSNTSVIRGGNLFITGNTYSIELDTVGMSVGVTTITASITIGDEIYADSCVVTVT